MTRTNSSIRNRTTAILVGFALAVSGIAVAAPRGDDAARKSKNGKAEGTAGGASVTVEYGRPNAAGRKLYGNLVPYGQVWRAGADEATTISFDKPVKVEGQALAAGRYALFFIPSEGDWTVVFNKTADQWGAYKYDPAQDALRVTVKSRAIPAVETLEYVVARERVEMRWGELAVGFGITAG
jgi:hypothetical protein